VPAYPPLLPTPESQEETTGNTADEKAARLKAKSDSEANESKIMENYKIPAEM
jgi:hypothetical protein